MIRRPLLVLALLLGAPALAVAQIYEPLPTARVSLTPFLGYRVSHSLTGERSWDIDGERFGGQFEETRDGGTAVGAQAEVRILGPISALGSLAYSRPGNVTGTIVNGPAQVEYSGSGSRVWLARAGLAYRLPDPTPDRRRFRPAGILIVAPALVREESRSDPFAPDAGGTSINHWALSLGANVVAPLGSPNVAFMLGLDDFITFWNTDELASRFEEAYAVPARFAFDQSHILLLRVGVSLRF